MNTHRSTQDSVSKKPPPDNFHASDAIESLHAAILRVETMAQVAIEAVDQLRCPSAPAERRAFARMQILVAKAAGEASAALAEGDKLIAELAQHMRGRSDPHDQHARQGLDG
jgi:hypothetical protein